MTTEEVSGFLEGYRKGKMADAIQFDMGEGWGILFTIPSSSPAALERVGTQFLRLRAKRLRYVRQAMLRSALAGNLPVVIVTVLPEGTQMVYDLSTGEPLQVRFLRDAVLTALEQAANLLVSQGS